MHRLQSVAGQQLPGGNVIASPTVYIPDPFRLAPPTTLRVTDPQTPYQLKPKPADKPRLAA
jgi:hypothetical protein